MSGLLAVIPGRGGSKGIPFKNMRPLAGVPLIGYTIRAALDAASLTSVVVSTDSAEIAEYATSAGVPTLRLRPEHLSTDTTPSTDVVRYELARHVKETGTRPNHLVLLQPTSPLRTAAHIDEAVSRYLETGAPSLISVCDVGAGHPDYMYRQADGLLDRFLPGPAVARRQQLEQVYLRNGAIYITSVAYFEQTGKLVSERPAFYVMERRTSINVDEPEDLLFAQGLLSS